MKILHTSDWHLGRSLYGRKRYEEFTAFLEWLANLIEQKNIDALLVSGDVFDTSTPSNRAGFPPREWPQAAIRFGSSVCSVQLSASTICSAVSNPLLRQMAKNSFVVVTAMAFPQVTMQ